MQRVSSMSAFGRGRGARPPGMRVGNLDAQVRAALFGQGQGGYMLSFDQPEFLLQSAGGGSPVAAGNPIGFLLDQRPGPQPNIVVNGDFSGGGASWTAANTTLSVAAGIATLTNTATNGRIDSVSLPTVVGQRYKFSIRVLDGTNSVSVYVRDYANSSADAIAGVTVNPGATYEQVFTATTTTSQVRLFSIGSSTTVAKIGKVEITQVVGSPFQQGTSTARPTRQQDAQGYWYGNWDGTDDMMVSLSAVPWAGSIYLTTFAGLYRTGAINAPRVVVETSDNINSINYASAVYSGIDGSNLTSRSKGTIAIDAKVAGNFGVKEVVVAEACPSAPLAAISNSGVSSGDITQSQGTGGFANYLEYVGGRGSTSGFNIQARMYALLRVNSAQRLNASQIALGQAWVRSKMGA